MFTLNMKFSVNYRSFWPRLYVDVWRCLKKIQVIQILIDHDDVNAWNHAFCFFTLISQMHITYSQLNFAHHNMSAFPTFHTKDSWQFSDYSNYVVM